MKAEFKLLKGSGKVSLIVNGDLVAHSSSQFKEQLSQLFHETTVIELLLANVSAIDVSAIQLIKSCKAELAAAGKKINVFPPVKNELIELLTKTGLIKIVTSDN